MVDVRDLQFKKKLKKAEIISALVVGSKKRQKMSIFPFGRVKNDEGMVEDVRLLTNLFHVKTMKLDPEDECEEVPIKSLFCHAHEFKDNVNNFA